MEHCPPVPASPINCNLHQVRRDNNSRQDNSAEAGAAAEDSSSKNKDVLIESSGASNMIMPSQLKNDSPVLCFHPVICTVDFAVWKLISSTKLQAWRLTTPTIPIVGKLLLPQSPQLKEKNPMLQQNKLFSALGWRLHLDGDIFERYDFDDGASVTGNPTIIKNQDRNEIIARGLFFNANTVEDFRMINRNCLISTLLQPVIELLEEAANAIQTLLNEELDRQPFLPLKTPLRNYSSQHIPLLLQCRTLENNTIAQMFRFFLLTFADLKSHLYYYNVATPALRPTIDFKRLTTQIEAIDHYIIRKIGSALLNIHSALTSTGSSLKDVKMFESNETLPGFSGCCALIRRLPVTSTVVENQKVEEEQHWTEVLLNNSSVDKRSSSTGNHSQIPILSINNDYCLITLLTLLVFYNRYDLSSESSHSKKSDSHLIRFRSTEVLIVALDSSDDLSGWPLRSLLFALGYLGLSGGPLPVFLYKDGVQQSEQEDNNVRFHTFSAPLVVLMPPKDAFIIKKSGDGALVSEEIMEQTSIEPLQSKTATRDIIVKGWLKRRAELTGKKSVTFLVNMRRHLDPVIAQSDAVHLNVRLIQWRILPQFDCAKLQELRFLLIGMGTLGCTIARNLVGWGCRRLSFIDNAKVALSSPVRQCLYTHNDAITCEDGKLKVYAAKERLLEIRPDLLINAIPMELPMPGHSRFLATSDSEKSLDVSVRFLERVIDAHDVVFLLTDSRESRWLPSLITVSRPFRQDSRQRTEQTPSSYSPFSHTLPTYSDTGNNPVLSSLYPEEAWSSLFTAPPQYNSPVVITVALGFDSFVVMRHGQRNTISSHEAPQLACYFCNDLSAPIDSIAHRPLDQQCTVTRPGISYLASSVASELVAAISQHPLAPDPPHSAFDLGPAAEQQSCLGAVPHTIRGTLGGFSLAAIQTEAFKNCICCCQAICKAYCSEGKMKFLKDAIGRSESLEDVSGLTEVKQCYRMTEVLNFDDDDEFNDVDEKI